MYSQIKLIMYSIPTVISINKCSYQLCYPYCYVKHNFVTGNYVPGIISYVQEILDKQTYSILEVHSDSGGFILPADLREIYSPVPCKHIQLTCEVGTNLLTNAIGGGLAYMIQRLVMHIQK